MAVMRIALGALQYFWPREQTLAYYQQALDWSLDSIYLGETVCSKRRELRLADWLHIGDQFAARGTEVVLSSLALLEAESELSQLRRLCANGRFLIEANDIAAVQACRELGVRFVGGPTLNVYNLGTLQMLRADGLVRLALGVELGREWIEQMRAAACAADLELPPLEVIAWGRLPLAYSARCFTARALGLGKDDCAFRCLDYPDGLPLATREGSDFLTINGIQVQSHECSDLAPVIDELSAAGVDMLRLYPQAQAMPQVLERFRAALDGAVPAPLGDHGLGYWHPRVPAPLSV
jgi:O2-independent ubiquinone biosynthesis protein UbiV